MSAFARNLHSRQKQRLRIDIAVHLQSKNLSELLRIHVSRRQRGFVQVGAGARIVVLRRRHLCADSQCTGKARDERAAIEPHVNLESTATRYLLPVQLAIPRLYRLLHTAQDLDSTT